LRNWETSDAVHPDDLPRVKKAWRHAVETGEPYAICGRLKQTISYGVCEVGVLDIPQGGLD
jgi:hypothetical protein